MRPAFMVSVGGAGALALNDRLLELVVNDTEGSESDSVTIVVDDRDGAVAIPQTGATIMVALGYKESGVYPMGQFIVDEVSVEGWPRKMTIKGRSAEMRDKFKSQRSKGYEQKTVKDVVGEVAGRHGLSADVRGSVGSFQYGYLAQSEESDLHFITRLAKKHDCVASVKNGKLIFCKKGEGGMGVVTITNPGQIKSYNVRFQDRPKHKEAKGSWWDKEKAERKNETGSGSDGGGGYLMGHLWPDGQKEAQECAQSKADALKRDEKVGEFEVVGDPRVMAEMLLAVAGVRAGVDGLYRIKSVEHTLNNNGYSTKISTEKPGKGGGGGSGN